MTQTIQNGISSLENLFSVNKFRIPQYQRAYSWEPVPQLGAFLEDLRQQVKTQARFPDKHYFLGTLLLHEEDRGDSGKVVNIVDGQQRMTTAVVFIATALRLDREKNIQLVTEKPKLLGRHFIRDEDAHTQKFHTIQEDEPFFQSGVLGISAANAIGDSPSAHRLKSAVDYFTANVAANEWDALLKALRTARVMVYGVDSAEDATQIFELQNDRGKPLTSLEALKSFLMHCVYLHSPNKADSVLQALQTEFATIFRTIESLNEWRMAPDEDQLLANHCAAFLPWSDKEYNDPKQLVKSIIKTKDDKQVVEWIQNFVTSLKTSYLSVQEMFKKRDSLQEFSELLLLGRMGSYWPLLLKSWNQDSAEKKNFCSVCRLLEVFTFRGPAVAGLRSDTGLSTFQTLARDFKGDFPVVFDKLHEMSRAYGLDKRFESELDSPSFYEWGHDARYLLWRYENHLRDEQGQKQPLLRWQDFVEPRNHAAKFSLEHVAAQDDPAAQHTVEWEPGVPAPFAEVALHRLGNLVIDSISSNSSKGKKDFSGKLKSLSQNSVYLSQGELINFLPDQAVMVWDIEAVRKRHDQLTKFARHTWNPDRWHVPKSRVSNV